MFSIIPFILIVVSLGVIIAIVVRKYPQLSLLDVDNLPEVKQEKKKRELWRRRAEKKTKKTLSERAQELAPLMERAGSIQKRFRQYVGGMEQKLHQHMRKVKQKQEEAQSDGGGVDAKKLVQEGQFAYEREEYETAEQKFIAAIRADKKNGDAYRGLGDVYYALEQYKEAEQTYQFLLQLDPKDDSTLVRLAELAEKDHDLRRAIDYYEQAILINDHSAMRFYKLAELLQESGQNETALEALKEAVDLEPQNPKYLDNLIEISIMVGDKMLSEEALKQLRMVNPDNQKIEIFADKIQEMRLR